jgi:hypothetical protein
MVSVGRSVMVNLLFIARKIRYSGAPQGGETLTQQYSVDLLNPSGDKNKLGILRILESD